MWEKFNYAHIIWLDQGKYNNKFLIILLLLDYNKVQDECYFLYKFLSQLVFFLFLCILFKNMKKMDVCNFYTNST